MTDISLSSHFPVTRGCYTQAVNGIRKGLKQERMIIMKKALIIVSVISIAAGIALGVIVLRDGAVSISEAAAIFAYLAAVNVGVLTAGRPAKKAPEENKPASPLKVVFRRDPSDTSDTRDRAA